MSIYVCCKSYLLKTFFKPLTAQHSTLNVSRYLDSKSIGHKCKWRGLVNTSLEYISAVKLSRKLPSTFFSEEKADKQILNIQYRTWYEQKVQIVYRKEETTVNNWFVLCLIHNFSSTYFLFCHKFSHSLSHFLAFHFTILNKDPDQITGNYQIQNAISIGQNHSNWSSHFQATVHKHTHTHIWI